jgi:hypothetical protein
MLNELGLDLKKTSNNEYHGPCPFCKEGTDRFWVTPHPHDSEVGLYYCRRCKQGGKVSNLVEFLGGEKSAVPKKNSFSKSHQGKSMIRNGMIKQPPSIEWQEKIQKKVNGCLMGLGIEEIYRRRGINKKTMEELKLGFNGKDSKITINDQIITFRKGMVIPNNRANILYSVQIREWPEGRYHYCKGSVPVPYHFTKLKILEAPVIIVESALDAAIIYQEAGDWVHAVALGSAQVKPDAYLKMLISKATQVFVCLDYDDAGIEATAWWAEHYPEAKIGYCPKGKDVGDFHVGGGDVKDWVNTLITQGDIPPRPKTDAEIHALADTADIEQLLNSIKGNGLTPGISISEHYLGIAVTGHAFAIGLQDISQGALALLNGIPLISHDGVDIIEKLTAMGLKCRNVESTRLQFFAMSGMLWTLEKLAQYLLGYSSGDYAGDEKMRVAMSAYICWEMYQLQDVKLQGKNLGKAYHLFSKAQPAVAAIRTTGFYFDKESYANIVANWQDQLTRFDPESEEYSDIQDRLLTYNETYPEKYCAGPSSRIYPDFQYKESPTARFICPNPNLLGVPKDELRSVFRATEGKVLLGADYSQIDLRTAAMITGDEKMISAFANGVDFHALTAAAIHSIDLKDVTIEQRRCAKSVNYAVIYGGNTPQAKDSRTRMSATFPKFYGWISRQAGSFRKVNFIKTPSGREILRTSSYSKWKSQICNYPIQGGSSEVLLAAMSNLSEALEGLDVRIILCIHDEIIIESAEQDADAAGNALVASMQQGFLDIFPDGPVNGLVNLKQGKTWADIS